MNPWEIVSWIGAIAVAILITIITAAMAVALIRGKAKPKEDGFTSIIKNIERN